MRAFIIVYTGTKFTLDSGLLVKKFEAGSHQPWDRSESASPSMGLAPGIYGILSDLTITDTSIVAVDAAPTQYDVLIIRGKDGWPDPRIAAGSRMMAKFPNTVDSELETFLGAKEVAKVAARQ